MELELLGWPPDGPKIRLDYRRFSYAGKFVMTNTGKAVARASNDEGDDVLAAASFNEDRTDADTLWIRYVTVAKSRRGGGIGPRLLGFVRDRAIERGYDRVRIAVNNPFAYEALYRTGFRFTGETTGLAELVLEYSAEGGTGGGKVDDSSETIAYPYQETADYHDGLDLFRERELSSKEESFLDDRLE
ncbi:GNAT family N-acetyltransferase [Halostagnicola bangensis]